MALRLVLAQRILFLIGDVVLGKFLNLKTVLTDETKMCTQGTFIEWRTDEVFEVFCACISLFRFFFALDANEDVFFTKAGSPFLADELFLADEAS